ncbi:hypothetical protein TNCV_2806521 [Trichonephila clavipes]|nr:hypothetical protein TNCV_2806521 [Trichonephila clavipes]
MKLNQIASEERSGLSSAQTENPVLSALADRLEEINLRVGRLQEASSVTARKSEGNSFNRRENVFKCFYCGIQGHRQAECRKRRRDKNAAHYQPPRRNAASEYSVSSHPGLDGRHVHFRESTFRDNYAAPRYPEFVGCVSYPTEKGDAFPRLEEGIAPVNTSCFGEKKSPRCREDADESINAALIEDQNMKLNQIASEERSGLSSAQTENPVLSALADRLEEINLRVGRLQEASSVTARKSEGNSFNRRENVFKCFYCGIQGHRQAECRKRRRDKNAAHYQPPRRNAASEYSVSSHPGLDGRHVHFRESTFRDNYAAPRYPEFVGCVSYPTEKGDAFPRLEEGIAPVNTSCFGEKEESKVQRGRRNDIRRFVLSRDPLNLDESINAALIEDQNMKLNQIASEERSGLSSAQTENPVLSALADRLEEINLRVGRLQEASSVTARKSEGNSFNRRENVFKCFYCGIQGHRQAECRKRRRDKNAAHYQPPGETPLASILFQVTPV